MDGKVILSTGDIKLDYEIVDIIFAAQVIRSHWVRSGGRETMEFLPEVNEKLKQAAIEKGCDAVIWIDYDFDRDPNVQILTAYGTGVKFAKK
jgi:uncharacterized protein YbjQ (UPF0145 family)